MKKDVAKIVLFAKVGQTAKNGKKYHHNLCPHQKLRGGNWRRVIIQLLSNN